jgi:hypothetical protein
MLIFKNVKTCKELKLEKLNGTKPKNGTVLPRFMKHFPEILT